MIGRKNGYQIGSALVIILLSVNIDTSSLAMQIEREGELRSRSWSVLEEALRDKNPVARERAIMVLWDISDKRALPLIETALADPFGPARAHAIKALSLVDKGSFFDRLPEFLKDGDNFVQLRTIQILREINPDREELRFLIPTLETLLNDDSGTVRSWAMYFIANILGKESLSIAKDFILSESDPEIRASAIYSLHQVKDKTAINLVLPFLKDGNTAIAAKAAWVLGIIGDESVVADLEALLSNEHYRVRINAAAALYKLGRREKIDLVRTELNNEDESIRYYALITLLGVVDETEKAKLAEEKLQDQNKFIRRLMLDALSRIKDRSLTSEVKKFLKDKDEDIRIAAASLLLELGDKSAVQVFMDALKSTNALHRRAALEGLGKTGDPKFLSVIGQSLNDNDPLVRASAVKALVEIKGNGLKIRLLEAALTDKVFDVSQNAAEALIGIAGKSAIPIFEQALESNNLFVRVLAAGSIIKLLAGFR